MKYHLHVTSTDSLGMNLIENVIKLANQGAVLKEGTIPMMRFPHSVSMVIECEEPPYSSATVRVFEYGSSQEVFNPAPAVIGTGPTGGFSMDNDVTKNGDTPWTREELEKMEWKTEFKAVCAAAGIKGRDREQMTKEYLAKFE